MTEPFHFELTDGERRHPLWLRLAAHLEKELQRQRCRNDAALDEQRTAIVRGHIECLKSFIALGDTPPSDGN